MLFRVSAELEYVARFPSTLILNIQAQRNASQVILDEQLTVEPRIKVAEFTDAHRQPASCAWRPASTRRFALHYSASVDCDFQTYRAGAVEATPVAELSAATIPYLFPSRYCQSDRLSRLAWDLFGADREPAREGRRHQRLDPRQRRVPARLDRLDDLGVRHRDAAHRRLPRLLAPRHRAVPGPEHSRRATSPATPTSSSRPTSTPASSASSAAAGRCSTPPSWRT